MHALCSTVLYTICASNLFKVWHDRLLVSVLNDKITLMHYINISLSLIDTWELFIGFLSVITKCSINRGYGLFFNVYYESVSEGLSVILKHFNPDIGEKSLRHFPVLSWVTYLYILTLLNVYVNRYQTGDQICEVILCIYCCVWTPLSSGFNRKHCKKEVITSAVDERKAMYVPLKFDVRFIEFSAFLSCINKPVNIWTSDIKLIMNKSACADVI